MVKDCIDHTIWQIVDSHWRNISRETLQGHNSASATCFIGCLADYLWSLGFEFPSCIDYCLAHNEIYKIKYRCFGGKIHIYVNLL